MPTPRIPRNNSANTGIPPVEDTAENINITVQEGTTSVSEPEEMPEVVIVPTITEPEKVTIKAAVIDNSKFPDDKVKIRLAQDHTCTIGDTKYNFEKRKVYDVPLNVKKVLERANLLAPL